MSGGRNLRSTEEGDCATTFQGPTTQQLGSYPGDSPVTSYHQVCHRSMNHHLISQPDDASWMRRDTVAIKNSKSR